MPENVQRITWEVVITIVLCGCDVFIFLRQQIYDYLVFACNAIMYTYYMPNYYTRQQTAEVIIM